MPTNNNDEVMQELSILFVYENNRNAIENMIQELVRQKLDYKEKYKAAGTDVRRKKIMDTLINIDLLQNNQQSELIKIEEQIASHKIV